MSNDILVQPKEYITVKTAYSVSIRLTDLKLGHSVLALVELKDDESRVFDVKQILIEGDDYARWVDSDDYIIDYVCQQLGLTKQ